ncbi:hypothetical protein SDC9_110587 [bioreactor metagenome]|uniref:Uncharacterized protein n=1 Tax=bioreactor metagenome TaxID=1076179 RepID=A0A645BE33_9ZZZZ
MHPEAVLLAGHDPGDEDGPHAVVVAVHVVVLLRAVGSHQRQLDPLGAGRPQAESGTTAEQACAEHAGVDRGGERDATHGTSFWVGWGGATGGRPVRTGPVAAAAGSSADPGRGCSVGPRRRCAPVRPAPGAAPGTGSDKGQVKIPYKCGFRD